MHITPVTDAMSRLCSWAWSQGIRGSPGPSTHPHKGWRGQVHTKGNHRPKGAEVNVNRGQEVGLSPGEEHNQA